MAEVNKDEVNGAVLSCGNCFYLSDKPDLSDEKRYKATTDYWFGQEL